MICGFVDEEEAVFLQKESCEKNLGSLSIGESAERAMEHMVGHSEQRDFPGDLPVFAAGRDVPENLHSMYSVIRNMIREVFEGRSRNNGTLMFITSQE
jgi:hypothetical protein